MSHHSDTFDPEMAKRLKDMFKDEPLGPTRRFPLGKMTAQDEGELAFAIVSLDGKVVINFNSPVNWFAMTPNQAIDLANALKKHAIAINMGKG